MKPTPRQIANEARWALERENTSDEERRAIRDLGILDPFETGAWAPRLSVPKFPMRNPTTIPDDRTVMGSCEEMVAKTGGHIIRHVDEDGQESYEFLGCAIGPDDTVTGPDGFPLQVIIGPNA